MGWLREFMSQAGQRSFGELARQALAHPDWPEDTRAQPRSLETILGRLDRSEDTDWLLERPGVQQVLASLLKVTVAEIRTILVGATGPRPNFNRLRLDDVRVARSFELPHEPLPPTIPERVSLPATWTRCCWTADHGAGFSLVGQWLMARGLAQAQAIDTEERLQQLPKAGPPLYLEVPFEIAAKFRSIWGGTQPLCLAIATPDDPAAVAQALPDFELLHSTPIVECLEQIVDWVLFRLAGRPILKRQGLLDWLRQMPLNWGVLMTLGDTLGFIGACLDGLIEPTASISKEDLLRQWMRERTDSLARERHRDVASLREALPDALVDIAQSALVDDSRPLLIARTIEEWLALVPEQLRRGPDIDWLTTRLVSENLPMRKPDLERAAKALPPGAHRIIVALRELSVLRPIAESRFAIRPHFVARLVHSIARDRIAASAPVFWGEGLLRAAARAELLPALQARAYRHPEALAEDVIEQVDLVNPALVGAFEGSFVVLGLAVLSGIDLGEQTSASLLREQSALLLTDVAELPCPRLRPSQPAGLADLPGTFFLAAWALSEQSRVHPEPLPPALDPWQSAALPPEWPALLDSVVESIRGALVARPLWFAGAIRLLDRIRQSIGANAGPDQRPHVLFLAGALLDAAELGVLEWSQIEELLPCPWQLQFLLASAKLRGIGTEQLIQAVVAAWLESSRPSSGMVLFTQWAADFCRYAPAAVIGGLLADPACELTPASLGELPLSAYEAWIDARHATVLESELPWQLVPLSIAERALQSDPPRRDSVFVIVWQRFPDLAMRQVERSRTVAPTLAARWLHLAPLAQASAIAKYADLCAWRNASEVVTAELGRLMHLAVAARVLDWPLAYDCLNQLQALRHRLEERA
jgi:hypothetical protein